MSAFIHIYLGPDDKVEANVLDGLVRIIDKGGATLGVIVPPSDYQQTMDVCDTVISAFMDLRGRAATKLLQVQRDKERDQRNLASLGFVGPAIGGGWAGQHDDPSQHDREAGHDSTLGG